MRTLIDIPEDHIKALDRIGKREDVSRAELVRRAVASYLEQEKQKAMNLDNDIFGMATPGDPRYFEGLDALEYEQKIRSEWDDRDKMYRDWALNDQP